MSSVIIKSSKIHGKGVFANRNLKKGEIVMKWNTSTVLIKSEARKIPEKFKKYLVFSNGKYIMAQPPEKYVNHSCKPNTREGNHYDFAIRNIRKGEELTTDYSQNAPPHIKMKCACGNRNCKKII